MATNKERQAAYKARKRAAGYKRKEAWVREDTDWGLWERFIGKLDELTAGWGGARLSGLFGRFIRTAEAEARKEGPEKKAEKQPGHK
jgi:hypothetical protein